MTEEELPGKKRPCRSPAPNSKRKKPSRRKRGAGVGETLPLSAPCFSIASFFNNVPPSRVSCPLCGQMVSRYRINQHIDEVCQKSLANDGVLVDSVPDAGPSVENVPGGRSPYSANRALTPEKLAGDNSEAKPGGGGQVSPYFKKGSRLLLSDAEPKVQAVRKISLGSLSGKLSRRRHAEGGSIFTRDAKSQPAQDVCDSSREENPEGTTSSQKENWLPFPRPQKQPSPKERFSGKRETLDPTREGEARTLLGGGDGSSPGLFPSGHLACSDVRLLTEDSKEQNTPEEDLDSGICKRVVYSAAYSKEALPDFETTDISSGEQAAEIPNVKGISCNQTPNTHFVVGDVEVLPMEEHTDLKNEAIDSVCLGCLKNTNSQSPSSSILEMVLNGPSRAEDPAGQPYYLRNFLMVLQAVLENEDDRRLFDEQDLDTIAKFYQLSASAQKLYVRLFQRKLGWIKMNKIVYLEIAEELSPYINELLGAGFFQSEAELRDLSEALDLLSAPELKTLAKVFHLPNPNAQKQQLLEDFLQLSKQSSVFSRNQAGIGNVILKRAKDLAGRSVRVCKGPRSVFSRLLLLFSLADPVEDEEAGSGGQGQLSTVLMVNMGRMIFPSYTVNRKTQLFQDRDDFIRYANAAHLSNDISVAVAHGNWKEAHRLYEGAKEIWQELRGHFSLRYHAALPEYLRRFTVGWVYTRIFSQGVEILQRLHRYKEAVEQLQDLLGQGVYCSDSRGRWWDRLALNLHQHLKDTEEAIRCIREGLQDPFVRTGHRLSLSQRAQRMKNSSACKKMGHLLRDLPLFSVEDVAHVTIRGKLCPQTGMGKSMFIMKDGANDPGEDSAVVCSVEELALAHYKQLGFDQGIHGEGSTFSTLYSLLMWDIIFMDGIPDVFRNPYQTCPLDLHTDSFYENRREAIESRLRLLHDASPETLEKWIADVWSAQEGKAAALISWDRFSSLQQAQHLASCFGGPFLSGVCRQLSRDLRHCRGGLPDLVVWRTEDHHFKLVEVKGPNDRLSHKQMIWLAELRKLGAAVEVCHVVATGSKSKQLS